MLHSRWFRRYTVTGVLPHGALEVSKEDDTTFKVNGQLQNIMMKGCS
ncbi:hypothetical protein L195_g062986, partial [Trifolium pratense]